MYKFTLQNVLDYRKILEENIQREMVVLKNSKNEEKRILEKIYNKLERYENELKWTSKKSKKASVIFSYLKYIEYISSEFENQKIKLLTIEEKIKNKRRELLDARKNKKVLEELKSKERFKYNQKKERKEQEFLDDISINKYIKSKKNREVI
jgi:flagellar FliJ protein